MSRTAWPWATRGVALFKDMRAPNSSAGTRITRHSSGSVAKLVVNAESRSIGNCRRRLRKGSDKGRLSGHVASGNGSDLPFAQHGQDLVPGDRPTGGVEALSPEPRPDQTLNPAVILLNDITEILHPAQLGRVPQLAVLLHRLGRARVGGSLVHGDGAPVQCARLLPNLAKGAGAAACPVQARRPESSGRARCDRPPRRGRTACFQGCGS